MSDCKSSESEYPVEVENKSIERKWRQHSE